MIELMSALGNRCLAGVLVGMVALVLGACAATHDPGPAESNAKVAEGPDGRVHRLSGQASWYGEPFHGRTTASGEPYDMNQLTAAHRTLPFGTKVRVLAPASGRSVEVRITDRGPFVGNRVIDLSYAAARELDMVEAGLAHVELEILAWEPGD